MFTNHQEIDAVGRVRSVQTLDLLTNGPRSSPGPSSTDAADAGERYWRFLRRVGLGLLRVKPRSDGGVEVGLPGLLLLAFGAPKIAPHDGGFAVRYAIESGIMVQRQGRGQGYLQIGLGARRVSMAVEGYYSAMVGPRRNPLRVAPYLATQSTLHLVVARAFLHELKRVVMSEAGG